MAAVSFNLIDVEEPCLRETFTNAKQDALDHLVFFGTVPHRDVFFDTVGIHNAGRRMSHAGRNVHESLDGVVAVEEETNGTGKRSQEHLGKNDQHHHLVQQGMFHGLFRMAIARVAQEHLVQVVL